MLADMARGMSDRPHPYTCANQRDPQGVLRRVLVIQPALPHYRRDFFIRIAQNLAQTFLLYYSPASMEELTKHGQRLPCTIQVGPIMTILPGVQWQRGALSIPIHQGDVLIVSGNPRCLSNIFLILKAKRRGAQTVWWGQYWSSTTKSHRFLIRMLLMSMVDAVLLYTDAELASYRNSFLGRKDSRIVSALNNGIDVEPIKNEIKHYSVADRDNAGLFIGRITDKSNLRLLIAAMAQPGLEDFHLHIIGSGSRKHHLRELAQGLGVAERIIWHTGSVDEKAIASVANRCRVFIYPGAVGLSLIHAMAYGLPAIVHDNRRRHMPEIAAFIDGENGRAFREGSATSLATTIAEMVGNAPLLEAMSASSLMMAHEKYNTAVMAERFIACVRALSGEQGR